MPVKAACRMLPRPSERARWGKGGFPFPPKTSCGQCRHALVPHERDCALREGTPSFPQCALAGEGRFGQMPVPPAKNAAAYVMCCHRHATVRAGERMRLICFNIGWMKYYDGQDDIISNFKYVKEHRTGEEIFNFTKRDGYCYGNVPIRYIDGRSVALHIERIGADKDAMSVDEVTVVFFSRHPVKKKSYVVGWYRNAVVFRKEQREQWQGMELKYSAKACYEDCVCVREDERCFEIPSGRVLKGGYGQGTQWYADADEPAITALRTRLMAYIARSSSATRP